MTARAPGSADAGNADSEIEHDLIADGEFHRDGGLRLVSPVRAARAAGKPVRLVWVNEVGGRTFEVGDGQGRHFIKWTPVSSGIDLDREVARLCWAARFIAVPAVLDQGGDEAGSWTVTAGGLSR